MDRLSTLDAEFLHMEDGAAHMHIAGLCTFEDPAPTLDELQALVESKLHLIPRYRQRIRTVPGELGRPVWVDDPGFDIAYHLRHTALPAPGGDDELTALMSRLMSQPLDRAKPLWEAWLVEGLAEHRWALIFKVHHCMVDGVAGVGLLTAVFAAEATTHVDPPEPWTPEPEPAAPFLVVDAWWGLMGDAVSWLRRVPRAVTSPVDTARAVLSTGRGFVRLVTDLVPTPPLSIDGTIGSHRAWAHSSASLGDVRTIRSAFEGTINDVVLTVVAGGYRELLARHGDDPDHVELRAMVPVSVRSDAGRGVADNEISTMLYELPVHIADPVERLHVVHCEMAELKVSHEVEAGSLLFAIGNVVPPALVGPATRLATRAEHRFPQRMVNTITTNVPGPQFPIYCLGREMLAYFPFVPISYGVRVSTAILSYNGRLFFGVSGDYDTVPDVDVVARAAEHGIAELRSRALASTTRSMSKPKPRPKAAKAAVAKRPAAKVPAAKRPATKRPAAKRRATKRPPAG